MTDILALAERVKAVVEADEAERYVTLTQAELDRLHTYQFTLPTNPSPGFVYKKEFWRIPGEKRWWTGPNEAGVRWAIGEHLQRQDLQRNLMSRYYRGPLVSFWQVYTCELALNELGVVLHRPKEAKIVG